MTPPTAAPPDIRRDVGLWAIAAGVLVVAALYLFGPQEDLGAFVERWALIPLLAGAILAFVIRRRSETRRATVFWNLWAVAFGVVLVIRLWYLQAENAWILRGNQFCEKVLKV